MDTLTAQARAEAQAEAQRHGILVLGAPGGASGLVTATLGLLTGVALPCPSAALTRVGDGVAADGCPDLTARHDALLAVAGSAWDDWGTVDPLWLRSPAAAVPKARLLDWLHRRFGDVARFTHERGGTGAFMVNDPRACRLVPPWLDVLDAYGARASAVLTVRAPLEVAGYLRAVGGQSTAAIALLWLRYLLEAEAATRGLPRVVVLLSDFLDDPAATTTRIATGLSLPLGTQAQTARYLELLEPGLRQLRRAQRRRKLREQMALAQPPEVATWLRECYRALATLANSPPAGEDAAALDVLTDIRAQFERSTALFAPLVRHEMAAARAAQLQARADQVRTAERLQSALKARLETHETTLARQAAAREDALRHKISTVEQQAAACEDALRQEISTLETTRDVALLHLNALQSTAAWQLSAPLRRLDAGLPGLTRRLATLYRIAWSVLTLRLPTYLRERRQSRLVRASGRFDEAWYVRQHPDAVLAGYPPLQHWLRHGWREGRNPAADFDTAAYLKQHPELLAGAQDPITHWVAGPDHRLGAYRPGGLDLAHRVWRSLPLSIDTKVRIKRQTLKLLGRKAQAAPETQALLATDRDQPSATPQPVPLTEQPPPAAETLPVRLVALYLPQFHPIAENDAWWGRGFTEWRNVVRGQPRFTGHYQPHLPGELGFYDLRLVDVQRRQVELAKRYGVGAFCFYFYWFGGKRLLEHPIRQYRDHPELDLPFCLCWANENWSRRWDGRDRDVLMAQEHSPADDLAFIAHVAAYFSDPRYLRIGERPLLLVYRPALLPSARDTAARWRRWCREQGIGEIYLAYAQSFEAVDPADYGFDAAIEFPPNYHLPPDITEQVPDPAPDFTGSVFDWNGFVAVSRDYPQPPYKLFRTVNPGWDNDARRPGRGSIFHGSSPAGYAEWLENAARDTVARFDTPDERLVFVNAWNEWAEGAHLEPDQRYGYAYLQATRDALTRSAADTPRVLVVTHDTERNGAQLLALSITTLLREALQCDATVIALGGGPLRGAFERVAPVHDLSGVDPAGDTARALAQRLHRQGYRAALLNTVVSGPFAATLADAGMTVVALVHELPRLIEARGLAAHVRTIAEHARRVVFAADEVRAGFEQFAPLRPGQAVIRPQGLYQRNPLADPQRQPQARADLREHLGLPGDAEVVLGVGFGDRRKGIDLFVAMGCAVMRARPAAHCVWVGDVDATLRDGLMAEVRDSGLAPRFHFPGWQDNTGLFYAGADVYALTSREDPFPSVVLEALHVGVPVVAFAGGGGYVRLADSGCVQLVPDFDPDAFAAAVVRLLADADQRERLAADARALVRRAYGFQRYVYDLLALLPVPTKRVSVVIPNYNYKHYLPARLASVAAQTWPIYETIVLDDASSDGSAEWLARALPEYLPESTLLAGDTNSGSVFQQWLNGVEQASGDFVWIAEADDEAEPDFLRTALQPFADASVVLSYTESTSIDADGNILDTNYQQYVADLGVAHWQAPFVARGDEELAQYLCVKNTIPNVSACVFRRDALLAVLRAHIDTLKRFRVAGDWITYCHLAQRGAIAFTPQSLNRHRRHAAGMTLGDDPLRHLEEILKVQQLVRQLCELPAPSQAAALAYAQKLYQQFELATAEWPTVADHPRLRPYLSLGQLDAPVSV